MAGLCPWPTRIVCPSSSSRVMRLSVLIGEISFDGIHIFIALNIHMSNSIFIQGIRTSPGPWHVKRVGADNRPEFEICDLHGKPIAYINPPHPDTCTPEQFQHNLAAFSNIPRLLAALTELAYTYESVVGSPESELLALIRDCGGVDVKSNESQTTAKN